MFAPINEQMDLIRSGTVEIIPEDELVKKLEYAAKKNKPLNIKLGADPSRPDLHIGHAVVLHKMRQFQDLGHHAILIIGDFTAMIGDPTGKSKTRPQLSLEDTKINGQSYLEQAAIILEKSEMEVRYNSEWLNAFNFSDVIKLAANYTVAQMLERDDFTKRYKSGTPISIHEFLYPLAQAYDSYAIKSDIELGGTDQKFNLLVGREIQRSYDMIPQCILTMPILEGLDGVQKMSKSLDNYVALTDSPREMFGKIMSIPDNLITRYMKYSAFCTDEECKCVDEGLVDGAVHPRTAKVKCAQKIVALYHDDDAAVAALDEFERMFVKKELPDDIETTNLGVEEITLINAIAEAKLCPSKKEGRRLIQQGAVSVDSEKQEDPNMTIDLNEKHLLKVGKRKFMYIEK